MSSEKVIGPYMNLLLYERAGSGNLRGLDEAYHGTLRPERTTDSIAYGQGVQGSEVSGR